jgi:hypothetical protein
MAAKALQYARSELSFEVFRERVRTLTDSIPTLAQPSRPMEA